jgi:hypothetical protein
MSVKYHKEKGYGRQKIGDQKSSGFDSLAKGDGFGSRDLQGEPRLSKGRTIWIDKPNALCRSISSGQYCGRARQTVKR